MDEHSEGFRGYGVPGRGRRCPNQGTGPITAVTQAAYTVIGTGSGVPGEIVKTAETAIEAAAHFHAMSRAVGRGGKVEVLKANGRPVSMATVERQAQRERDGEASLRPAGGT